MPSVKQYQDLFGTEDVALEPGALRVGSKRYPVIDDVVVLLDPMQYTPYVKLRLAGRAGTAVAGSVLKKEFAEDIQFSFGDEWQQYDKVLPEHEREFAQYFDLIDLAGLKDKRVCDLGCGNGRWSYFIKDHCRELVVLDFSDAVFAARRNLEGAQNCLFFMGDLTKLPFREGFADFLFCLGVLHHLPVDCLQEVRKLKSKAPLLLLYLYYALDNRPAYYRWILATVTAVRLQLTKFRSPGFRKGFSIFGTWFIYLPLVLLGKLLQALFGAGRYVPLYDGYHEMSLKRIEQDVYDRFFTRIEQRVTRAQIQQLSDTFREVRVSDSIPYWHFTCS